MAMLFEVMRNTTVMMSTTYEECIPSPDVLQQMIAAGYTFRKNKKTWNPIIKRNKKKKKVIECDEEDPIHHFSGKTKNKGGYNYMITALESGNTSSITAPQNPDIYGGTPFFVTDNFVKIGDFAYPITHSFIVGEQWIPDLGVLIALESYNAVLPKGPLNTSYEAF